MSNSTLSPSAKEITYPPDLLRRYGQDSRDGAQRDPRLPPYRVVPSIQYKPGNEAEFARDLESLIDMRAAFAGRLMEDQPWDFMMVHFLATDLSQHALWRYMDPSHPHNLARTH